MTDSSRDDLASAVLDGLLGPEEAADALRDPAVTRRVEEMRAVRSLLATPPAVDPARREHAIASALAAATEHRPAAGPPDHPERGAGAGAVSLDDRRRARQAPPRRANPARWLPAAAVILVVLALAGLVAVSGSSSEDSDMAAESSSDDRSSQDASGPAAESSGSADPADAPTESDTGAAGPTAAPGPAAGSGDADAQESAEPDDAAAADATPPSGGDLGAFTSTEGLAAAAGRAADNATAPGALGADEEAARTEAFTDAAGCGPPAAVRASGTTTVLVAEARLDGAPVTVWVLDGPDAPDGRDGPGGRRAVVVDAACAVVDDRAVASG